MIKITCDRCPTEFPVSFEKRYEFSVKVDYGWVELCPECMRVYQTIDDKVADYRADLRDKFINNK